MHPTTIAAVAVLSVCFGAPLDARHAETQEYEEPCKQVRNHVAKWMSENNIVPKDSTEFEQAIIPAAPAAPIPPSIAFECLKSVPLYKDTALGQLNFLRPLFEWQSTLDDLREPPEGYLSEGVDLLGGLDNITAKLQEAQGSYKNEFEFLADLYTLTSVRPRDLHFRYTSSLFDLFSFPRPARFVSISTDGISEPKIYLHADVNHAERRYTPSPVLTIDGIPALEFLQKESVKDGGCHDPDARFNRQFPSLANDAALVYTPSEPAALDLRDTTTVECQNGTKFEFSNFAFVRGNFSNITTGVDLYNDFGRGNGTGPRTSEAGNYVLLAKNYTSHFVGYPIPTNRTKNGNVAGFLPNKPEFSDVAVLVVNSFQGILGPDTFVTPPGVYFQEFFNVTTDFIRAAKAANRSKLILDVQGNSGGLVYNIATLYFALFPGSTLPQLSRARSHPQFAWLGAHLWNGTTSPAAGVWPLNNFIRPDHHPWTSFADLYGPHPDTGTPHEYTNPSIFNVTNYTQLFAAYQDPLNANGAQYTIPWTEPPFAPEDILIVSDGQCGSACAMTVSMLTHVHGVRTVALGGRPLLAPMQALGQTKGGPVINFAGMPEVDRGAVPEGLVLPPPADGFKPPLRVPGLEGVRGLGWGVTVSFNVVNMFPWGEEMEEGEVPLQMRYEAANCKLFFTWDMARDITAVWGAAAAAAWQGGQCVPGSTTNEEGTMGGIPGYTEKVADQYKLGDGPGVFGSD
ncbi:hypothetical protein CHGG_00004 [Chaetomium globosum CBS 148.51]|uniref:CPAF-like PDZ domain-containing protein n=1 Tax=Chaetomium globosum (strain ATCC 6205 / CBS 148.51 / DSM 1962 / NBRC 6347 / NRRL 1970) TaxID=306901 RepID=Q2HIF0_CHAGB|nr:uncharacterized protein CHGG_00004 [Chaetomium globosum CBS 148.51]EAQ91769.1 hypothetical protein CHGG_00004 [Chaetomium globosum CBS 148.51]